LNFLVTGTDHKWYDIYYDAITSKKIPVLQRFGDRKDEPSTARFGGIPCSCQDLTCGCCAQFNVRFFDYNKKGLFNIFIFILSTMNTNRVGKHHPTKISIIKKF